jgi:hypothetical protein
VRGGERRRRQLAGSFGDALYARAPTSTRSIGICDVETPVGLCQLEFGSGSGVLRTGGSEELVLLPAVVITEEKWKLLAKFLFSAQQLIGKEVGKLLGFSNSERRRQGEMK